MKNVKFSWHFCLPDINYRKKLIIRRDDTFKDAYQFEICLLNDLSQCYLSLPIRKLTYWNVTFNNKKLQLTMCSPRERKKTK